MKKNSFLIVCTAVFLAVSAVAIGFSYKVNNIHVTYSDGEWSGTGNGRNGPITVSITVRDGVITEGKVISEEETDYAKPAISSILQDVIAKQSTKGIDVVSGATLTSKGTFEAVKNSLAFASGCGKVEVKAVENCSCDLVIIGAGGAGLSAATRARQKGLSVIVVEKMGIAGGNTNAATGGLNASETSVQKALGIQDSNEQYYLDTMKGGYNLNDKDLVRNMVEKSASTVDWLISLGADLTDVGKMAGSTNKRTHRPQGGAAIGSHLVPVLEKAALDSGADIRFNSKVTDILENDGIPCGVKVWTSQGDYTINSKAVIIATGGFGANPEMVVKYNKALEGFGTTNHKGATGDAFAWVEKFNAELVQMEQIQTHPTVVPKNGIMITEAVRGNGAIMVNREGKRFGNEMATRDVMSAAVLAQTGKSAYLLFDQGVRESLKAIESYAKQGLLTEGDSVKDLALKLNIEPSVLEETVSSYNKIQASGNDTDFGRPAGDMPRALNKAPFYAVEVAPAVHHTMGGIKINTKAQVINKDGNVIPGLFACGEVTGGVHGGNRLGGNAVADICIYGKIAAEEAAEYISK